MARQRKTRQQKIKADSRRNIKPALDNIDTVQYQLPTNINKPIPVQAPKPIVSSTTFLDYRFLPNDLIKTVTIVGVILIIEIFIKIIFQNA
jgi:hypothetical protein